MDSVGVDVDIPRQQLRKCDYVVENPVCISEV